MSYFLQKPIAAGVTKPFIIRMHIHYVEKNQRREISLIIDFFHEPAGKIIEIINVRQTGYGVMV